LESLEIHEGGRRRLTFSWKSGKVLASIEDILEVFNSSLRINFSYRPEK
jgi:hypothetical protein